MARKYATADRVGETELLDFIRPRHHMVLTTFRADGSPQTSPVTGGVDTAGRLVIASYPQRAKAVNVRRSGTASVLVLSDEFNGPYVQVDGDAEVVELPDGSMLRGVAEGIDSVGRLLVRDDSGVQPVAAGDVTHLRYE